MAESNHEAASTSNLPRDSPPVARDDDALVVGISGPSSSGKTTLARLLQSVFSGVVLRDVDGDASLRTFIIHEDDFYYPDDRIPYTTTPSGATVQDWDTIAAIDVSFLSSALVYVRTHGSLPPRLKSKEDLNEAADAGVDKASVRLLRAHVARRLAQYWPRKKTAAPAPAPATNVDVAVEHAPAPTTAATTRPRKSSITADSGVGTAAPPPPPPPTTTTTTSTSTSTTTTTSAPLRTLAFLEGFLLFSPPPSEAPDHALRPVDANIHLRLFIPAAHDVVKARREARSGYVTMGPAPAPPLPQRDTSNAVPEPVDLEAEEEDRPPQNFWVDPPGYVDDVVWPHYVEDHAWLLLPEQGGAGADGQQQQGQQRYSSSQELVRSRGQGLNVRTDTGVLVAPEKGGDLPMAEILKWAVEQILTFCETQAS